MALLSYQTGSISAYLTGSPTMILSRFARARAKRSKLATHAFSELIDHLNEFAS